MSIQSAVFTMFNSEARAVSKVLKKAGAKPSITEYNFPLYQFLSKRTNQDVLVHSREIVDGVVKRPETINAVTAIIEKGLTHILTIRKQVEINPLKAIRDIFSMAEKNPKGIALFEDMADSFHPIKFKQMIAEGVIPAIESAKPGNAETLKEIMPALVEQGVLTPELVKGFLLKNVNLY